MSSKLIYSTITAFLLTIISLNSFADGHGHHSSEQDLDSILSKQPVEAQARYEYRHPKETLKFFGIKPGMKVIEVLPGGGWYSKILLPYLGKKGELVGADYPLDMWPNFSFMTPERLEGKKTWISTWTNNAEQWRDDSSAPVTAFQFANMPAELENSADAILFIRALHNLSRFESKGGFLTSTLNETYKALKPGGIVGIVQHQALEDRPDDWANGSNGYLKKSFVLEKMAKHGFEYIGESDINANPIDQANVGDYVWRLPPSLRVQDDDPKLRSQMMKIGESNRMTLLFKKPVN